MKFPLTLTILIFSASVQIVSAQDKTQANTANKATAVTGSTTSSGSSNTGKQQNKAPVKVAPAPKTAAPTFKPGTGAPIPNQQKGPAPDTTK